MIGNMGKYVPLTDFKRACLIVRTNASAKHHGLEDQSARWEPMKVQSQGGQGLGCAVVAGKNNLEYKTSFHKLDAITSHVTTYIFAQHPTYNMYFTSLWGV
jgi:hypothetical protein